MASLEEIKKERLEKISKLRSEGVEVYPIEANPDYSLQKVAELFSKLKNRNRDLVVAGRVWGWRGQGGLIFLDLVDGTGKFQIVFKLNEKNEAEMARFESLIDRGDFIEFTGSLFLTKTEEKSLEVKSWRILAKATRPLPDKWHGLTDTEERYRRRYLDSLFNNEVKERFILRSSLITFLRHFLDEAGYLEVETPILQSVAGGASAKPFKTKHEALGLDLYLRISPELFLKKMLVGGFPRVYELSRCFRNEGIDATHNPEFTMLEFYESYSDAAKQRAFVEKLFKALAGKFGQKWKIEHEGEVLDFSGDFKIVSYYELFKRYALINDPAALPIKELELKASQLGIELPTGAPRAKWLDQVYKKVCRPKLTQPTFIVDYPKDGLPLVKAEKENPDLVDAFQLVIGGIEMVKAFSELNDPEEQRARFRQEERNRQAGDVEAQVADEDFVEAMEYGMPPAGGVGIGIDRLVMLFSHAANIREVIFFPTLRPRPEENIDKKNNHLLV